MPVAAGMAKSFHFNVENPLVGGNSDGEPGQEVSPALETTCDLGTIKEEGLSGKGFVRMVGTALRGNRRRGWR